MKTMMTMTILMLISTNTFAFAKKTHFEFNSDGSTICSDRSSGKGTSEEAPAPVADTDDSGAATN